MRRQNIKQLLKEYYFKNSAKKLRVREIEREVRIPLPSVIKYVKELVKEGFLKKINISNITIYTTSENLTFKTEKKMFNLRQIYESGLIEHIRRKYANPTIILFGSYDKGEDEETSDIDLFIQTNVKISELNQFEKILGHKIQLFTADNIHNITNVELANNIINGTMLNGSLKVLPCEIGKNAKKKNSLKIYPPT